MDATTKAAAAAAASAAAAINPALGAVVAGGAVLTDAIVNAINAHSPAYVAHNQLASHIREWDDGKSTDEQMAEWCLVLGPTVADVATIRNFVGPPKQSSWPHVLAIAFGGKMTVATTAPVTGSIMGAAANAAVTATKAVGVTVRPPAVQPAAAANATAASAAANAKTAANAAGAARTAAAIGGGGGGGAQGEQSLFGGSGGALLPSVTIGGLTVSPVLLLALAGVVVLLVVKK